MPFTEWVRHLEGITTGFFVSGVNNVPLPALGRAQNGMRAKAD